MRKKYSGRLLISASATVGALLLVALMCFWGSFLFKRFGRNEKKGLAKNVGGGTLLYNFMNYIKLSIYCIFVVHANIFLNPKVLASL